MKAYKLFRIKRNRAITPLFIGKKNELPFDVWMGAEDIPTNGYAHRPGWHCTLKPVAPHLAENPAHETRVWLEVEVEGCRRFNRPQSQGGTWVLAENMKIPNNQFNRNQISQKHEQRNS